ncbi:MAG: LD-carboxypeptidase [Candidatus Kapabacteria bacterium]|nr:LD-carboxypeptidase [Candidatus Kapabacteria bacterium]
MFIDSLSRVFHTNLTHFPNMYVPRALPKGGTIGIVSPSSPQRDFARLERGIAYLESIGYRVEVGVNASKVHGAYLAGTDQERLDDLHAMIRDPRIDAIFCARGGYGTPRMLDGLDYSLFRRHPKIIVGFSDVTALQLALWKRLKLVTFSGMLPSVDFADTVDAESEAWFWRVLTSTRPLGTIRQSQPIHRLRSGDAVGPLLPGNLTMISHLLGTPYMPMVKGAVLVLEDVGEDTYRIDRMLTQLRLAGALRDAAAVGFGSFTQSEQRTTSTPHRPVEEVLSEFAASASGPVISNVMYGHQAKKLTLPVGVRTRISYRLHGMQLMDAAVC